MPEVASLEIAGNGYINVRLARGAYAESVCRRLARKRTATARRRRSSSSTPTSIRIKPRTSGICATRFWAIRSCACCASAAAMVEVQNYIDNTGVQVADVVVGFHPSGKARLGGSSRADRRSETRASIICAGIFMRACRRYYKENPEALEVARAKRCMRLRRGRASWRSLGTSVADAIVHGAS